MGAYIAKNGFTLLDADTKKGWSIKGPADIITALLDNPNLQTVATEALWQALAQAIDERKEYQDINDLAQFVADNYI